MGGMTGLGDTMARRWPFGIDAARTAARLRLLADAVERGGDAMVPADPRPIGVIVQSVTESETRSEEDFTTKTLTVMFCEADG